MRLVPAYVLPRHSRDDVSSPAPSDRRRFLLSPNGRSFRLLLLLFVLTPLATAVSQPPTASSGESFFIALPWTAPADEQFLRVNITAVTQCEVTVTVTESGAQERRTLMPNAKWEFLISRSQFMLLPGEYKSNSTIHVESTGPVTVNVVDDGPYITDNYCALPITTYGYEYYAISYADSTLLGGSVAAIATQDDTEIRITPTVTTARGNLPGFTYGVTLNKGEVYQIVPDQPDGNDLSGTRITSDKPIVVLSGHQGTRLIDPANAQNSLIEQMVPVADWGHRFYARPLPGQERGLYKVVASQAGTIVRRNGFPVDTIGAGESTTFSFEEPVIIETSKPSAVAQFTTHFKPDSSGSTPVDLKPNGDPSMMLLNPVESFARSYLWMTPFLIPRIYLPSLHDADPDTIRIPFEHYVMVTAPVFGRTSVRLDDQPIDFDRIGVPYGDGDYVTATVSISAGVHRLTASVPIDAKIFGYSFFDAYASPAGVLMRDPFRAEELLGRTCNDYLDTLIDLVNVGGKTIEVTGHTFTGVTGTVIDPGYYPFEVQPISKRVMRVRIALPGYGEHQGTLTITTTTGGMRPLEIPIHITRDSIALGTVEPELTFRTVSGSGVSRDTVLHVVNTGTGPLVVADIGFSGPFSLVAPTLPVTIQPGDTVDLMLRFTTTGMGTFKGEIRLNPTPCAEQVRVPLEGRRIRAAAIVATADTAGLTLLCPNPNYQDFPVTISNPGEETLHVDSAVVEGIDRSDFLLLSAANGSDVAPGDMLHLTMRFLPTSTGLRTATLAIYSNAPVDPVLALPLGGRKDSIKLTTSTTDLDVGRQTGCDPSLQRSVVVRNDGSTALTIDSTLFAEGEFSSALATPSVIEPGDSVEIPLTFTPHASGVRLDTLRLYTSPCGDPTTIHLRGEQQAAGIAMSADTLDFGTIPLCTGYALRGFTIANTGTTTDSILSLDISGPGFTLDGPTDSVLAQGATSDTIAVRFDPGAEGTFLATATLRAQPCGLERRMVLRGTILAPSLAPAADIHLGELSANVAVTGTTTLDNDGDLGMVVRRIMISPPVPGLTITAPDLPVTIARGSSIPIEFSYLSDAPTDIAATVTAEVDSPCVATTTWRIDGTAKADSIALTISLPDTTGRINERIRLPLRVVGPDNGDAEFTVTGTLRWHNRNLKHRGISTPIAGGTIAIVADKADANDRVVEFRYDGPLPSTGTLAELDLLALLGDSEITPVTIVTPRAIPKQPGTTARVVGIDGAVRLTGVCRLDNRLIELTGAFRIGPITPNPVSSTATAEIEIPETGRVTLQVLDDLGREALRPIDTEMQAGVHNVVLDLGTLPSGIYLLRLRFGERQMYEKVLLRQ